MPDYEPPSGRPALSGIWQTRAWAFEPRHKPRAQHVPVVPRCLACQLQQMSGDDAAIRREMERRVAAWLKGKGITE